MRKNFKNTYYHILRDSEGSHSVVELPHINSLTPSAGIFGRRDYAEHWKNYYNGDISEADHEKFIND